MRAEVDYAGTLLEVIFSESEQSESPMCVGDKVEIGIRRGFVFPKEATGRAEPMRLVPFRRTGGVRATARPTSARG